jgi:hypothetical protein
METAPRRKKGSTLNTLVALAGCEKTIAAFLEFNGSYVWDGKIFFAGCSKRPSSEAAASEEARRTLRYVEPLSAARTKLAGFFSVRPAP